ncbi:ABC transporter substrate-binding protein [Sulfobacillus harzensis]|uniref:Probable sugar-binding periplasmic protein n=1 Tax=Sulfobacillus harzensis TaxID=2729629 RepID=A0A7Y0L3Z0_9FIRM|nr:ABC transporter substrate-binding protein [Sulfobacillus harzensis]NMP22868.1 carbohydrate ABC transporter substrate-binding protein [Sulfobacillus harzensis]
MMNRKQIALGAAGLLSVAVVAAGCGSSSSTGKVSSPSSNTVDIFSWWTGTASSKALNTFFEAFKAQYPNVKVVNDAVAGGAGSNAKAVLASRMNAGKPPSTFQVHVGNGSLKSWVEAGKLQPLNSLFKQQGWYSDYPKSLLNLAMFNGKIYAVPVDMQRANVLWYNTKIFKQYNLTPPTSWSQFISEAKILKQHGITPLAVANHGNWETTLLWSDILLGTVGYKNYDAILDGKIPLNSAGVKQASETYLEVMKYTNSNASSLHWAQADQMVAQGQAAMNVMGDWAAGYFTTTAGLTPGQQFGWAPTPGTKGVFAAVSDAFGLPTGLTGTAKTNAIDFLKVLGSNAGQAKFNPLKGTFSPRLDANPAQYNAYSKSAMKSYKKDPLVLIPGQGALNPGFTTALENAMSQFTASGNVNQFVQALQSAASANPLN